MANTRLSNPAAIDALDAITANLNSGSIKIFDGAIPADCEAADAGTVLAELSLSATAFAAAADNLAGGAEASANTITGDASANATGTAQYFRAYDSVGTTCIIQGDVNTAGGDLNLDTTSINAGDTVDISSWTLTLPEA